MPTLKGMKKLIFLAVVAALVYYKYPALMNFMGMSASSCGITADAPLGDVDLLSIVLVKKGFEEADSPPGGLKFVNAKDTAGNSGFANAILVYPKSGPVKKVNALFPTIARLVAGAPKTNVENFMTAYWKLLSGEKKPRFQNVNDGSVKIYGINLSYSHMQADFETESAIGMWAYDERNPIEVVELRMR